MFNYIDLLLERNFSLYIHTSRNSRQNHYPRLKKNLAISTIQSLISSTFLWFKKLCSLLYGYTCSCEYVYIYTSIQPGSGVDGPHTDITFSDRFSSLKTFVNVLGIDSVARGPFYIRTVRTRFGPYIYTCISYELRLVN